MMEQEGGNSPQKRSCLLKKNINLLYRPTIVQLVSAWFGKGGTSRPLHPVHVPDSILAR